MNRKEIEDLIAESKAREEEKENTEKENTRKHLDWVYQICCDAIKDKMVKSRKTSLDAEIKLKSDFYQKLHTIFTWVSRNLLFRLIMEKFNKDGWDCSEFEIIHKQQDLTYYHYFVKIKIKPHEPV